MRYDPILETKLEHTGVDFGARWEHPSTPRGRTVVSRPPWRYGNCTIIDHGNSLATLYGHQSVIGVTVGQKVTKGR